jgi:phosphoserine phosphatase RsbU/P
MQAKSRSLLVAVLVTSAIALLDAGTGDHEVLLGLLIAGPLLAAASLDPQRTATIGLYALGLAVLLGIPDGIFGTTDHLLGCLVVATGGALGAVLAHRRTQQEQLLGRVTRIAEVAQQTILRPIPPRMGRVALAVRYLSATEDALVGGDFYDLAVTRHGLRVLVGDVKGKGLEAVQLAALVLASFRAAAAHPGLVELAAELDHSIRPRVGEEDFVTAVLAQFSRHGELQLVNCGHPPPLRLRAGAAQRLASTEPTTPLGLDPAPSIQRFTLAATDRVLLYTDGLVEARRPTGSRSSWTARCRRWLPRHRWAPRWTGWLPGCWPMRGAGWTTTWRWCWRSLAGDRLISERVDGLQAVAEMAHGVQPPAVRAPSGWR